jgi:hypothetical protein
MTQSTNAPSDSAGQLRRAMDDVRRGDFAAVSVLQRSGDAFASELAPYLADKNEDVRREAIVLLAGGGGSVAFSLLERGLADVSADVRERSAIALYEHYGPANYCESPTFESSLLKCLQLPDPPAAAVLLLSYCSGEQGGAVLERLVAAGEGRVKLFSYSAPAPLRLVALFALARRGEPERQAELKRAAEQANVGELEFLLDAIREADSVPVLGVIARLLDDTRPSGTLIHSAPGIKPRLCDRAVNALVRRLELPVTFELTEVRPYTADELSEVRRLVSEALPRSPIA